MTRLLAILVLVLLCLLAATAGSAHAAQFTVVSTLDSGEAPAARGDGVCSSVGDGRCTLRAALEETNALGTSDIVNVNPGTYTLVDGHLLIGPNATVEVNGTGGAGATTIQSAGPFRVLCITGASDVLLQGLLIHGGRPRPEAGDCGDGQGGGIHAEGTSSILDVRRSVIQQNAAAPNPSAGGGGGVFAAGDLFVRESIVRDNSTNSDVLAGDNKGGGGIRWRGPPATQFVVSDSSVYGNTATVGGTGSGGGGIYSNGPPLLENVTLSSNRHIAVFGAPAGGGGGGILVKGPPGGSIVHATFFGNHSDRSGGALGGDQNTDLENSVFQGNTAPSDPDCPAAASNSLGGNVSNTPSPTCGFDATNDRAGVDPQLGPLALNNSDNTKATPTHALLARQSPAVEFPGNCPLPQDQRGVSRSQFFEDPPPDCDSGAYEFDGRTTADVPACSPTGVIPLTLEEPPGGKVSRLRYRVNGGPELEQAVPDPVNGGPPTATSVTFDEGRATLEYWGFWSNGVQQGHGLQSVLVDKTRPAVDVENPQGQSIFVITRRARVNVAAQDALSGLAQDPSATGVPVDTGARGPATVTRTAADLCQNQASDSFDYRVLAPGLGVRTVLERVSGTIRVRQAGGRARAQASQKGQPFAPLTEPRELPVRSFIDAKRGTVRLTTARTRREDQIQDGLFAAGVFQVLQSRRVRSKGLTEVRLKGGNFRRCRASGSQTGPRASQVRRRVIRRLRGNGQGRFRTRGRHSAATVRGTKWQVIDRCDGTLTKVTRGRVAVRDFRRKKTVIVRAGKSYLARAPR